MGYETTGAIGQGAYKALGTVFTDVSGTDIKVKDLFKYATGEAAGSDTCDLSADQIWRWNTKAATWTKYFYFTKRKVVFKGWSKDGEEGVETTDAIAPGETFFFLRNGDNPVTLTLSGAVKELTGKSSFSAGQGDLAFASNPFPVEMNVKDFTNYYTVGEPAGSDTCDLSADQIWLWNTETSTWAKYFYFTKRKVEFKGWSRSDLPGEETTDKIPAGSGFFFQRAGDNEVTITLGM